MVDEFAAVWPIVALEGVGDLIGDARPGLVAIDGGRRLGFANAAARALLSADAVWGGPLVLDRRLADRVARFAARAVPGEETRELLRFAEAERPVLRTVSFRRPIDADDAVIVSVEAPVGDQALADPRASLAPFARDGGLVALFDGAGDVLAAFGDFDLAEGLETAIEAVLAEPDDVAVIERRLSVADGRHALALVRLGEGAEARRLLRLGPAEPRTATARPAPAPTEPAIADLEPAAPETAPAVLSDTATSEPSADALDRREHHAEEADAVSATTVVATAAPSPLSTDVAVPLAESPAPSVAETEDRDEDRFVAASPLALDLLTEEDGTEADLDEAWIGATTRALPPNETPEPVAAPAAVEEDGTEEDGTEADLDAAWIDAATHVPSQPEPPPIAAAEPRDDEAEGEAEPSRPLPLAGPTLTPPLTADEGDGETDDTEDRLPAPRPADAAAPAPFLAPAPEPSTPPDLPPDAPVADLPAIAPTAESDFRFAPLERPVKFVWQMDADRRFTLVSDELAGAVGPAAAELVGRRWDEVATAYDLDHDGVVAAALSRHDTWSGRTVLWPIEGEALRLPVDLAALPAFDRGRTFTGFRGFGTCRADAPVPDPTGLGRRLAPAVDAAAPRPAPLVESELEPPLFPADEESARIDQDHPIDDAFAGDLGDDPILAARVLAAVEWPATTEETAPAEAATPAEAPAVTSAEAPTEPDATDADTASLPSPTTAATTMPTGDETIAVAAPTPRLRETPAAAAPARPAVRVVGPQDLARLPKESTRLSVPERLAFRQIAEALGARIEGEPDPEPQHRTAPEDAPSRFVAAPAGETVAAPVVTPPAAPATEPAVPPSFDSRLVDRLPIAVALLRDDTLVHANERFLSLLRYPDLASLRAAGGADALFVGPHVARRFDTGRDHVTPVLARDGTVVPCDASIVTVPLDGASAVMLTLEERRPAAPGEAAPAAAADRDRIAELEAIVDTATDGVLMLDGSGLVLSANAAAEALFGVDRRAMIGRSLTDRLAPESRRSAMDYLDGLAANGVASVLNDGREVIGVVAPEGLIPLFMTIGRVSSGPFPRYCAVLRDITQWKKSEEELTSARRRAEEASIHKSDFLAKISHEIRTPLNAIIGFSELMLDERFGPVGSDRYKDYLRDIHVSGSHIMSLVNDLLDLSKVEAGKMDLRFEAVPLADVISESVALMQPQANRERIIIRSSLPAGIPPGEQSRDFVFVDDVCAVNLWCWHKGATGIFNCGTGRSQPFKTVAEGVIAGLGKGEIEYVDFPDHLKGRYQSFTQADVSKLRAAGYNGAFRDVETGVREYVAWLSARSS